MTTEFKERTEDEVLARIKALEKSDFFGFVRGDLIEYLSFDRAKPFLKEGVEREEWPSMSRARAPIIKQITEYMPFAWEKANNCRGISAGRSINHMQAWLWMLGEDSVVAAIDDYELYGKPHLAAICEHFGIDWKKLDDGHWQNSECDDGRAPEADDVSKLPWKSAPVEAVS